MRTILTDMIFNHMKKNGDVISIDGLVDLLKDQYPKMNKGQLISKIDREIEDDDRFEVINDHVHLS